MKKFFSLIRLFVLSVQRGVLFDYLRYKIWGGYVELPPQGLCRIIKNKQNATLFSIPSTDFSLYEYGLNPLFQLLIYPFFSLSVGSIFLDIGSFIGYYSLDLAKRYPTLKVFAIEPNPKTFEVLCQNIVINKFQDRIIPVNKAIGAVTGNLPFTLEGDTSHLLASPADHFSSSAIQVEVLQLSDFFSFYNVDISSVGLIKIDVEGYERPILEQLVLYTSFFSFGMKIICEIWDDGSSYKDECSALMKKNGFVCKKLDASNYLFTYVG